MGETEPAIHVAAHEGRILLGGAPDKLSNLVAVATKAALMDVGIAWLMELIVEWVGSELPFFDLRNTSPQQTPERASGSTLCAKTELGTRIRTLSLASRILRCGDQSGRCAAGMSSLVWSKALLGPVAT